ncbi:hypothetical protein JOL62DRAFT_575327, partial [Phyllosticta paracitricarpa]
IFPEEKVVAIWHLSFSHPSLPPPHETNLTLSTPYPSLTPRHSTPSRPIQIDHQQARTTVTGSAASHVQPSVPRATTQTNKPRKHLRKPDQTKSSQAAAAANNNKKRKTPSTTVTDRVNALMPEKSARRRVDLVLRRAGGKGMRQPVLPAVGCFWQCDRRSVGRSACRLMTPLATHTGKKKLGQARQRQHQYRCMHVALFFIWRRRHARGNVLTTLRTDDKRPRRRGIVRRQRPRKRGGVDGWSGVGESQGFACWGTDGCPHRLGVETRAPGSAAQGGDDGPAQ